MFEGWSRIYNIVWGQTMYIEEILYVEEIWLGKDIRTKREVSFLYFTWTGKMTPTVDCNKLDVYIR